MVGSFGNAGLGFGIAFELENMFSNTAKEIERDFDKLGSMADKAKLRMDQAWSQMGMGMGLLAAGAAGLAPFIANIKTYSDLQEATTKANVVFGQSIGDVTKFIKEQSQAYGQSRQQALDAAATYGNLFTSLGMGRKEAAGYSVELVKLAADLASFNNVGMEDTLHALRSVMTGEFEMAKRFGMALNTDLLKIRAKEMGLIQKTTGYLSPLVKMQAAYAEVMEQTKNAQGDFIRTSDGYANTLRMTTAAWSNFAAELGRTAESKATPFLKALTNTLIQMHRFMLTDLGQSLAGATMGFFALLASAGAFLAILGGVKLALYQSVHLFHGLAKQQLVTAFATRSLAGSFRALGVAIYTSLAPILPFIAVAALVVGAVYALYKSYTMFNDSSRDMSSNPLIKFFERIGGFISVIKQVWSSFDQLTSTFTLTQTAVERLKFLGIYDSAMNLASWITRLRSAFNGFKEGLKEAWGVAATVFKAIWNAAYTAFQPISEMLGVNMDGLDKWHTLGKIVGKAFVALFLLIAVPLGLLGAAVWGVGVFLWNVGVVAMTVGKIIGDSFYAAYNSVKFFFLGLVDYLKNFSLLNAGKSAMESFVNGMVMLGPMLVAALSDAIEALIAGTPLIGDLFIKAGLIDGVTGSNRTLPRSYSLAPNNSSTNRQMPLPFIPSQNPDPNSSVSPYAPSTRQIYLDSRLNLDGQTIYQNQQEYNEIENQR